MFNEKKVYYKATGEGEPLLLIHGNTLSSRMFSPVLKYYTDKFRVILIDLPGHGKSARLQTFPRDFWFENSKAVYELIRHMELPEVNVIGTGGGSLVALNLLLEHPDVVKGVIADSFEGTASVASYAENLHSVREKEKHKFMMKLMWFRSHGIWWRTVVDQDSDAVYSHHMEIKKFFHKSLSEISRPVLLTGSLEDKYLGDTIVEIYAELKEVMKGSRSHYFNSGSHPAMLSNSEEFAKIASEFFNAGK